MRNFFNMLTKLISELYMYVVELRERERLEFNQRQSDRSEYFRQMEQVKAQVDQLRNVSLSMATNKGIANG